MSSDRRLRSGHDPASWSGNRRSPFRSQPERSEACREGSGAARRSWVIHRVSPRRRLHHGRSRGRRPYRVGEGRLPITAQFAIRDARATAKGSGQRDHGHVRQPGLENDGAEALVTMIDGCGPAFAHKFRQATHELVHSTSSVWAKNGPFCELDLRHESSVRV
jgi:hypothetical protein